MPEVVFGKHDRLLKHLLFSNYLNFFAFSLFGPLYVLYISGMGVSILQISRLLAVSALSIGIFLYFFGRLQNSLPDKRQAVVIGFFLLASGAFSYLFVQSIISAYIVQVWNAIAAAWFLPAWKCLYGRGLPTGRETEGWGKVDGGSQILAAVGIACGGWLATTFGFYQLIVLVGVIQVLAGVYSLVLFRHEAP